MAITAAQIVARRTGASPEDVAFYLELADGRIRDFLGLDPSADISQYYLQESDIAVLYYQRDTSEQNMKFSLGFSADKFTEGQMSESHELLNASVVSGQFETSILEVLQSLNQDEHTIGMAVMY